MKFSVTLDSAAGSLAAGMCIGAAIGGLAAAAHWGKLNKKIISKPSTSSSASNNKEAKITKVTEATTTKSDDKAEKKEAGDDDLEMAADRTAFWFDENLTDVYGVRMALRRIMFDGRSKFQRVQVVETEQFGKTLVLDGQTQSALKDEKQYHETLVHPAMLQHPNPKSVFIGGGGEFATAREVLRHTSVTRCVMVDIDELACDMCREHLPEWGNGAYDDERFYVTYEDARVWLEESDETFDVMIMDICDPIEAGPGYRLYTQEFYEFCKTRLNDGGVLVTQSGPCAIYNAKEECFTVINRTLRAAFNCVVPMAVDVPSFGCVWGFNLAIKVGENGDDAALGAERKAEIVDTECAVWNKSLSARIPGSMFFLDGLSMRGLFGVPKSVRDHCDGEDRIMTIENPVFMFSG